MSVVLDAEALRLKEALLQDVATAQAQGKRVCRSVYTDSYGEMCLLATVDGGGDPRLLVRKAAAKLRCPATRARAIEIGFYEHGGPEADKIMRWTPDTSVNERIARSDEVGLVIGREIAFEIGLPDLGTS